MTLFVLVTSMTLLTTNPSTTSTTLPPGYCGHGPVEIYVSQGTARYVPQRLWLWRGKAGRWLRTRVVRLHPRLLPLPLSNGTMDGLPRVRREGIAMTTDEEARILALLRGEPVGVDCGCFEGMVLGSVCAQCGGTGRIRTMPEGPVEIAAAEARARIVHLQNRLSGEACREINSIVTDEVRNTEARLMRERDEALARARGAEEVARLALARAEEAERSLAALVTMEHEQRVRAERLNDEVKRLLAYGEIREHDAAIKRAERAEAVQPCGHPMEAHYREKRDRLVAALRATLMELKNPWAAWFVVEKATAVVEAALREEQNG